MLPRFVVTWLFNIAALWVAAKLLDGVQVTGDHAWVTFVLAGLVFSLANMVVKPIVAILAIPLIILTLGIAYFLVNVLMIFLTSWVVGDFHVDGFWSGVGAAVIVWVVNSLLAAVERRLAED
ncbi:MAG TPA: phage holin family protein [Conexibacter sp.]|nr:phage holin family protein [Conexibacter sp.]